MSEPLSSIEELLNSPPRVPSTHIVAIDGRAGSGKTTFAENLALYLSLHRTVEILHLDEVYSGWERALGSDLTATLAHVTSTLRDGGALTLDIFNWATGAYDSKRTIPSSDVLIIEGVGSAQEIIREMSTITVWLDIDPAVGFQRVLSRDGEEIRDQMTEWQKNEAEHFALDKTLEHVDFIFSTL